MTNRFHALSALLAMALWVSVPASAASPLNQQAVHRQYEDGNFDVVITALEHFVKQNRTYSREDSIFVSKHLSVVYAANPITVEKGKHWMHVFLSLMPAANLMDMYVSEEIDRIFEKVRQEFINRQKAFGVEAEALALPARPVRPVETATGPTSRGPALAKPGSGSTPPAHPEKPAGSSKWKASAAWTLGGVAVAAAGTLTYFALSAEDEEKIRRIHVGNTVEEE